MAEIPSIPTNTSIKELLSEVMPQIGKDTLSKNSAAAELSGKTITMVVEVDGDVYSYVVKDGADMTFSQDDIPEAMLRLKISGDHLKKMIETENLDMILGIQNDINLAKYNALNSLKGTFVAEVANDSTTFVINATLNGVSSPSSTFKMSAADTAALMKKETNPVNLFMSGAMKIEGDMAFAMATQPLFS